MNNLIDELAQRFGVSKEQVQAGAGAILQLLQQNGGKVDFQQLLGAVPGSAAWIEKAKGMTPANGQDGGGLLGQAAGLLGALGGQGAGGLSEVLGQLGKAGFKPDTAMQFVPALLEQLKGSAGPEVVNKLIDAAPALKESGGGALIGKLFR